jgi:predicted lipid-binding transport protein (Tim44 family)
MNEGFQFFDIILFAMVAGFILLRLRSVLGRRSGNQRRRPNFLSRRQVEDDSDKVIPLPDREGQAADAGDDFADVSDTALAAGLTQIKLADPGFGRKDFLEGARGAFELVVDAFAAGDSKALRPLLADDVFEPFAKSIRDRDTAEHTLETIVVSIDSSEIIEAGMNGRTAFVTVRIVSQQINVTRDAEDSVVDGNETTAVEVVDIWTFERDTRSRDPNWKLVATRSLN